MSLDTVLLFVVAAPACSFLFLAILWLLDARLPERFTAHFTCLVFVTMTIGCTWLGWSLLQDGAVIPWHGGAWFRAGEYEFQLDLIADRLSLPLMILTTVLVGLVGSFSRRYMHRESGFLRFYL